jgi:hypothetical protein
MSLFDFLMELAALPSGLTFFDRPGGAIQFDLSEYYESKQ